MADYEHKKDPVSQAEHDDPVHGLTELGNAAANQQAAELQGKDANGGDSQIQQSIEAKEEERKKAAKASWESLLGSKIGGKAFEAILDNVSYEDLLGYAKDGSEALGDALGDLVKKNPKGVKDPSKVAAALAKIVQGQVDKWLETPAGERIFTAISEWVQEHPKTVTAIIGSAVIGAAIGVFVTNMDVPEIKKVFKLGKGFEAGAAVDFGKIQSMTLEAAKIGIAYSSDGLKASIGAEYDKEKGISAKAKVEAKGEVGQTKLEANGQVEIADDGRATVKLDGGLETVVGQMPVGAKGAVSQAAGGGKDDALKVEGQLTFGEKGNQQIVKGTVDDSGAFTFKLDRTFLDGKGKYSQGVSQDKDGNTTATQGASYKDGDQQFGFSQSIGKDGTSNTVSASDKNVGDSGIGLSGKYQDKPGADQLNLGLGYTLGTFKSQLDYEMKDGMSALGGSASGNVTDNTKLSTNLRYNLSDSRLEAFGAKLNWKDPTAFRSFALEYKGKWLQDNSGYEHKFDSIFENSVGNLSGRLKGGLQLQGGSVSGANVDVLGGYKVNERNAALFGGGYEYNPANLNGAHQPYVQGGWQFTKQKISVLGRWSPTEGGGNQFTIGLSIPLGFGK